MANVEGARENGGEGDYEGGQDEWEDDILNSSRKRLGQQGGEEKEERGGGTR